VTTVRAADEPLVIAVDDTLERRFGRRVAHKGIYHDAVRSKPGHDPVPIRWVLLRDPAGKLKPMVLGCTDEAASPEHIVNRYILRWNIEVRTTPCLFGLFSLVVLLANRLHGSTMPMRQSAWYDKEEATFVDFLAVARREIWRTQLLNWPTQVHAPDLADPPGYEGPALAALLEAACYAA
jgi:hypothetical protein